MLAPGGRLKMLKKRPSSDVCILTAHALKGNCLHTRARAAEGGMGRSPSSGCPQTRCTCNPREATSTLFGACLLAASAFALINLYTEVSQGPRFESHLYVPNLVPAGDPTWWWSWPPHPPAHSQTGVRIRDPHAGTGQAAGSPPRGPRRNLPAACGGAPGPGPEPLPACSGQLQAAP